MRNHLRLAAAGREDHVPPRHGRSRQDGEDDAGRVPAVVGVRVGVVMGWTEQDLRARVQGRLADMPTAQPTRAYPPAIGRIAKPEMNKTETQYAERLELQKHVGAVLWWG